MPLHEGTGPQAYDGVERILRINSMRERFGIEDVNAILASSTPPPRYIQTLIVGF